MTNASTPAFYSAVRPGTRSRHRWSPSRRPGLRSPSTRAPDLPRSSRTRPLRARRVQWTAHHWHPPEPEVPRLRRPPFAAPAHPAATSTPRGAAALPRRPW